MSPSPRRPALTQSASTSSSEVGLLAARVRHINGALAIEESAGLLLPENNVLLQ